MTGTMAQCVVCGKEWDNDAYEEIVSSVTEHILTEHDLEEEWTPES